MIKKSFDCSRKTYRMFFFGIFYCPFFKWVGSNIDNKTIIWTISSHNQNIEQDNSLLHMIILLRSEIIFPGLLAGEILFWANFKISFSLAHHSQEKMRIGIDVQLQYACRVSVRVMHSSEGYRYYILVHDRRRWSYLETNGKLFYAKLKEENGGFEDKNIIW